jgi:hypothetical protein
MSKAVLEEAPAQYEFLNAKFLEAMNKIGDRSRGSLARTDSEVIANHSWNHFAEYLAGLPHDHFHTRKHQLAAVAFNAMMEFYFAGLEDEADHR